MTVSLYCLVGYAAWALVLVGLIAVARVTQVLRGEKRANEFASGVPHGGDGYWRINRAHVNTVENLPIFAAVVLVGAAAHVAAPLFQTLAAVVLGARVLQSLIHIASGAVMAVNCRFTAFLTQLVCVSLMIYLLVR